MNLRTLLTASCVLGAVLLSSCAADPDDSLSAGADSSVSVSIAKDDAVGHFAPGEVLVAVDGTVTWVNNSGVVHNVIFDDTSVQSSRLFSNGEKFSTEFGAAGVFAYHCSVHPTMKGTVTVR